MRKIWKVYETDLRRQVILCSELGISPLFAQILLNRDIVTPEQAQMALFGGLDSCHDPLLMKDMEKSVSRIKHAIARNEKILVYGDYDVDGVTATSLLSYTLGDLRADHEIFIPNRMEEGYGLNVKAVTLAKERGVGLIITVDCGINSFEEVRYANECGIDIIITDHHEIRGHDVPPAYAVIDACQADCRYPFKDLAGVGVAYKLARVLMEGREDMADAHLDLVALGTVADVAPLTGENRILVKEGLKRLKNTAKCGLEALMRSARIRSENITSTHISFMLGPRINAVGRVSSATIALDLLMCRDKAGACEIAEILERENRNRQAMQKDLFKEAVELIKTEVDLEKNKSIVLAGESWHKGVLGIVASKIAEEYALPAIMISMEGEEGKGSGRSVEGFNLFEALKESESHLIDFGGHEAACGVKIRQKDLENFRKALDSAAGRHFDLRQDVPPEIKIDLNLPFSCIGVKLIRELEMLMPYGTGNAEPVFATSGLKVKNSPRDIGRGGFKFLATCGNLTCEAITFRKNSVVRPSAGSVIDLAYTPSLNVWGGIETIQMNIKDLRIVS